MTTKPLLFLDVDGVLNAFSPVRPHTVHKLGGRWVKGIFCAYTIRFDNEVVEMIDALAEHFDIVWATMWNEKANADIAPALGIEPLPVMHCDHNKGWDTALDLGTEQWNIHSLWYAKTPLLPEYAAGQPFAWVDDDHSGADRTWLAQHGVDQPFMLCRTDADYGIQWDDVEALIDWAQKLATGTLSSPTTYVGAAKPAWAFVEDPEPVLWLEDEGDEYMPTDEEIAEFLAKLEDENA